MYLFPLVFLSLLAATSATDVAPDGYPDCEAWAERGECDKNNDFMSEHCATSCQKMQNDIAALSNFDVSSIKSFYDLKANDIDGNEVDFNVFRHKVVLVTNVASQCGYTEEHYEQLVKTSKQFQKDKVEIVIFPCNQFGGQEPGTAQEIKDFVRAKGGRDFRVMEKIRVNGPATHPVYQWLKQFAGKDHAEIPWNFSMYFVIHPEGEQGAVTAHPFAKPQELHPILQQWSEEL